MQLFTFILDYRGGTYISQVEATTVSRALDGWLDTFDLDVVFGLTNRSRDHFRACFADQTPTAVNEVVNVWCLTASPRGRFALLNVVMSHR